MPSHHGPGGRYHNPWPMEREATGGPADLLQWGWERWRGERAPNPAPEELPRAEPELAEPRLPSDAGDVRITWVGHATFLIQLPGVTFLTDPMFSERASPVGWAGPRRFSPPGLRLGTLPAVDAVILSHDHYDHLDAPSARALNDRFGDGLTWITPLGYSRWLTRHGAVRVAELDWWEAMQLEVGPAVSTIRAFPARHWTKRRLFDARKRLWASWSMEVADRSVYFAGDSGYCPAFAEVGERAGPFDVALVPIGAYEPRWFMKASHMNPEEAAQTARDVRAGAMVGMHWGTFRLTDEPPLEPPRRTRQAWSSLGLADEDLHIPALGQTLHF